MSLRAAILAGVAFLGIVLLGMPLFWIATRRKTRKDS